MQSGSSKSVKVAIFSVLLLIIVVAGASAAFAYNYFTPQETFYRALENRMSTAFIAQTYKLSVPSTSMTTIIKASSDFTRPSSPKTSLSYSFREGSSHSESGDIEGDQVFLSSGGFFGKLTSAPHLTAKDISLNKWYTVANDDAYALDVFDARNIRAGANSPLGILIDGNLTDGDKSALMRFIKENSVYTITDSRNETAAGEKVTAFDVTIDIKKANELNKKAATLMNVQNAPELPIAEAGSDMKYTFWVSNDRIVKLKMTGKPASNAQAIETEVTYTYPASLQVVEPSNP